MKNIFNNLFDLILYLVMVILIVIVSFFTISKLVDKNEMLVHAKSLEEYSGYSPYQSFYTDKNFISQINHDNGRFFSQVVFNVTSMGDHLNWGGNIWLFNFYSLNEKSYSDLVNTAGDISIYNTIKVYSNAGYGSLGQYHYKRLTNGFDLGFSTLWTVQTPISNLFNVSVSFGFEINSLHVNYTSGSYGSIKEGSRALFNDFIENLKLEIFSGLSFNNLFYLTYENAYSLGYNTGFNDALNSTLDQVYMSGYNAGFDAGKKDNTNNSSNYNIGYNDGYNEGYILGLDAGKLVGYNSGYDAGYNEGYSSGLDAEGSTSWFISILEGLSSLLSIQFLPGFTFATILFLPVIFGLFWWLIGLIKGKSD